MKILKFVMFIFVFLLVGFQFENVLARRGGGRKASQQNRGDGPSGKPKHHFTDLNSRKQAHDAARQAGFGFYFVVF